MLETLPEITVKQDLSDFPNFENCFLKFIKYLFFVLKKKTLFRRNIFRNHYQTDSKNMLCLIKFLKITFKIFDNHVNTFYHITNY